MSNHKWISTGDADVINLTEFENSYCTQPIAVVDSAATTSDNTMDYPDNVYEHTQPTYTKQNVTKQTATVNKPKVMFELQAEPIVEPKVEVKVESLPRRLVLPSEPINIKPVAAAGLCMILGACISNILR